MNSKPKDRNTIWPGRLNEIANSVADSIRGSPSLRTSIDSSKTPEAPPVVETPPVVEASPVNVVQTPRRPISITSTATNSKIILGKPWKHYEDFLEIELGGPATLAYRKSDKKGRQVFAIKKFNGTIETASILLGNLHTNIVRCYEAYNLREQVFLVEEYMEISLLEVITCTWGLEEDQIATICLEVSYRSFLCDSPTILWRD